MTPNPLDRLIREPWEVLRPYMNVRVIEPSGHEYLAGSIEIRVVNGQKICDILCNEKHLVEPLETARLIGAAPDLLLALTELLAHASFVGIAPHYENLARAAIAKALPPTQKETDHG